MTDAFIKSKYFLIEPFFTEGHYYLNVINDKDIIVDTRDHLNFLGAGLTIDVIPYKDHFVTRIYNNSCFKKGRICYNTVEHTFNFRKEQK